MSMPRNLSALARSSDGKGRLVTLASMILLASLLVLVMAVLPVGAGNGDETTTWEVQPHEHNLGGQANDCSVIQGDLPSAATYEFRIVNPQTGSYTDPGPGGAIFTLQVDNNETFDFSIAGGSVLDVVVKGGQKSTHFDYDATIGSKTSDTGLHAPTKGNNGPLYALSHTTFCYSETATISGTKYEDSDVSGDRGEGENGLEGWTIHLFNGSTHDTATTGPDGSYSFVVPVGTYTVCEELLGSDWRQSDPATGADCSGHTDGGTVTPAAFGHTVAATTAGNTYGGNDFGNWEVSCGETLTASGGVFVDATFTVFENGDGENSCDKAATLAVDGPGLLFGLSGAPGGEFAAIGEITRSFSTSVGSNPPPLEYSQNVVAPSFVVVPWCDLRLKGSQDNDDFDPYLDDDSMYPSLDGVVDPVTSNPSTACKVYEQGNAEGLQLTVVYAGGDPYFR